MGTSSSILPIKAAELISNQDGNLSSLPLLAYKIQDDKDQLIYVEALTFGLIGKGRDMDEAAEDLIEILKFYIQKVETTNKAVSFTQSGQDKIDIFQELYLKEKLFIQKSPLKKLNPTNMLIAI